MNHLADEISEFTKAVWAAVLDSEIDPTTASSEIDASSSTITAWVQISGAWTGALVLCCGLDAARLATSVMLEIEPDEASAAELADVVGELTNMIGGNVKALLPQPAVLGLPNVVEGKEYLMLLPGTKEVNRLGFDWRGSLVVVALMQRDD